MQVGSHELFVNAKADDGDGSAERPFPTITEALALAREIRGTSDLPITINVAPGKYTGGYPRPDSRPSAEVLPLVLDVSELTIRGHTGSKGTEIPKLLASPPLRLDQAAFAIISDDVAVEGISVRPGDTQLSLVPKSYGFFVDRARDFSLRDVKVARASNGVFTRLASGEIIDSEFTHNLVGTFVGAGSDELGYPGRIRYEGNRTTRNCVGGAFFSAGTFPLRRPPFDGNGGRVLPDAPVPAAPLLELEVAGSELVDDSPGCFVAELQLFLHLTGDAAQAGAISAFVHDNTMGGQNGHDIAVDSHLDPNPDGSCDSTAPASFTGEFARNVVSPDHSRIFFGFAFRFPGACYVNDSSITVSYPGDELDGFAHDNPAGFGNVLTVNGEQIED